MNIAGKSGEIGGAKDKLICIRLRRVRRNVDVVCAGQFVIKLNTAALRVGNEQIIVQPTLTSVDVGYQKVGYVAAEVLEGLMDGAAAPQEFIAIEPVGLFARQSTDVLAVDDPLVAAAMRYMSENGHQQIHVDDVARRVAASRRSLERRFRKSLGRSIAQELNRLRFERLKRLLLDTDTPIKVLAATSGFIDAKQLSKAFRRVEGITPAEYRRHHRRD